MEAGESGDVIAARIAARQGQYAAFLQDAQLLLGRRAEVNRFYTTLNLAIVGAAGFLFSDRIEMDADRIASVPLLVIAAVFAVAGLAVSWNWLSVIDSHRAILKLKFDVIHDLEKALPLKPYTDEWAVMKSTPRRRIGEFERRLPLMFMLFYALGLLTLLWLLLGSWLVMLLAG
jgi:hypothetical protein